MVSKRVGHIKTILVVNLSNGAYKGIYVDACETMPLYHQPLTYDTWTFNDGVNRITVTAQKCVKLDLEKSRYLAQRHRDKPLKRVFYAMSVSDLGCPTMVTLIYVKKEIGNE